MLELSAGQFYSCKIDKKTGLFEKIQRMCNVLRSRHLVSRSPFELQNLKVAHHFRGYDEVNELFSYYYVFRITCSFWSIPCCMRGSPLCSKKKPFSTQPTTGCQMAS